MPATSGTVSSTAPGSTTFPGYPPIELVAVAEEAVGSHVFADNANTVAGAASGTVTVGGAITAGNTLSVAIAGHAITVSVATGMTVASVAAAAASAINADSTDSAVVNAAASADVITITALETGSAGMLSLSASTAIGTGGSNTLTATASGSELDLAGGLVIPAVSFVLDGPSGPVGYTRGLPKVAPSALKASLRAEGLIY